MITVDPGKWILAWGNWDGPEMTHVGLSILPEMPLWHPASKLGVLAERHHHQIVMSIGAQSTDVLLEEMVHYPGQTAHVADAKAADLLELQAIGAMVAGRLAGPWSIRMTPARDWKGSVPKEVTQNHVDRALSTKETAVLDAAKKKVKAKLHHNLYDVAGMGLWFHGRIPGRVSPQELKL